MFAKKYHSIMEKGEDHRAKWAFGISLALSLFILVGFGFYKGYLNINFGSGQMASAVSASTDSVKTLSPIDNSKKIIKSALRDVKKQYDALKDSVASVLVPFMSGVEVYQKEQ